MVDPGTLAYISLAVIVVPIAITLLLALSAENAATSTVTYLSVAALPIGALGLVTSGCWWLLQRLL